MRYLTAIKILPALALLWGCGGLKDKAPHLTSSEEKPADSVFSESEKDIEVAGQKGVGKREGKNFFKTFTVDNRRAVTESVPHSFKTEVGQITITASATPVRKEETFTQPSTATGNLFALAAVPKNEQIETAYVNGVEAASGECIYYKPSNGAYFHSRQITAGSTVKIAYLVDGIQPTYAFSTDASAVGMSVSDATTGAGISATFEGNVANIKSNVAVGTKLNVKYYVPAQSAIEGTLTYEPMPDTTKVDLPECANAAVTVSGKIFTAKCAVIDKNLVPVNYSFIDPKLQKFSMAEVEQPDLGEWEIKIDGNVAQTYRREGTWFYLDEAIPFGSKVEIAHRVP